jgi:hypothetical protein
MLTILFTLLVMFSPFDLSGLLLTYCESTDGALPTIIKGIIIGLILSDASIIFAHPTFVLRFNSYEKTGPGAACQVGPVYAGLLPLELYFRTKTMFLKK